VCSRPPVRSGLSDPACPIRPVRSGPSDPARPIRPVRSGPSDPARPIRPVRSGPSDPARPIRAGGRCCPGHEPVQKPGSQQRGTAGQPGPRGRRRPLQVVAERDVDHALSDIEQLVARLRADAEEAAAAREVLRNTPADVLRQALRLRAARIGPAR